MKQQSAKTFSFKEHIKSSSMQHVDKSLYVWATRPSILNTCNILSLISTEVHQTTSFVAKKRQSAEGELQLAEVHGLFVRRQEKWRRRKRVAPSGMYLTKLRRIHRDETGAMLNRGARL